jgi:hypothetical protein
MPLVAPVVDATASEATYRSLRQTLDRNVRCNLRVAGAARLSVRVLLRASPRHGGDLRVIRCLERWHLRRRGACRASQASPAFTRATTLRLPPTGGACCARHSRRSCAGHKPATLRIPAKVTDESDDVDRVVSCGAWRSDFSAVGHHRCQFSVLESGSTTAGQPGSPASAWTEVADHWVAPVGCACIGFCFAGAAQWATGRWRGFALTIFSILFRWSSCAATRL